MSRMARRALTAAALLLGAAAPGGRAQEARWRAAVEGESRGFLRGAAFDGQARHAAALAMYGEGSLSWGGGDHLVTATPFVRLDAADGRRTHADFRVLAYERAWRAVELRVGVRRVFWGVTESRHLVDVINQTDLVENPDGEDKLGQPMVNVAWLGPLGTVDAFLLTGFRQRTYPGAAGRLRGPLVVEPGLAEFSEHGLRRHLGWAARWSRTLGGFDLGASYFDAMGREPELRPGTRPDGTPALVPMYRRAHRLGVDAQWTTGSWLWKFEGITQTGGPAGRVWAMVGGLEYTLYQLLGSAADLGVIAEVLLDTRETEPFQDDVFLGGRLAFNDVRSTELLAGAIVDRSSRATVLSVEAGRRLSGSWSLDLESRAFLHVPPTDPLYGLRSDDYVSLRVTRWF